MIARFSSGVLDRPLRRRHWHKIGDLCSYG